MAEILQVTNFDPINLVEKTKVDVDANPAQANITVENAQGFATDDFAILGQPGGEQSEIRKVLSVSGNVITFTSNLGFAHNRSEPVIKLRGDQARIYRAANVDGSIPVDANFSVIATKTIEADQLQTEHSDPTGGSDHWYKKTYHNSVSAIETDLADSRAVRGGDFGHYATLSEIRSEAGFDKNDNIGDDLIAEKRVDAEGEVKGTIAQRYALPLAFVPDVVRNATKLIAAGYLLLRSYGIGEEGTNKEGQAKLKAGRDILKRIKSSETVLLNVQDAVIDEATSGLSGYPDDSAPDNEQPKFKISDKY